MKSKVSVLIIIMCMASLSQIVAYAATQPPVVVTNRGIVVDEAGIVGIDVVNLVSSDPDTDDSLLTYVITTPPKYGQVEKISTPGTSITSFTQQDIMFGRIVYVHNGSNTTSDFLIFKVVDDKANAVVDQTLSITIIAKDYDPPMIVSSTIVEGNEYMDIVFSEGVYGSADKTKPVTAQDLKCFFYRRTGQATAIVINSISRNDNIDESKSKPLIGGETVIRVFFNITGFANGLESVEIKPASNTSIYDEFENSMVTTQSTGSQYLLPTDKQRVEADQIWLTTQRFLGENENQEEINAKLDLPSIGAYSSLISWESSEETIIDSEGNVVLPENETGNQVVTLTATINKNGIIRTKVFSLTVLAKQAPIPASNINSGVKIYIMKTAESETKRVENLLDTLVSEVTSVLILLDNEEVDELDHYEVILIPIAESADLNADITGVLLNDDISIVPVMTSLVQVEGKWYGQLRIRKSGVYTLTSQTLKINDIERHWVYEDASKLANQWVVSGNEEGLLLPDESLTRGEFIDIIVKSLGLYGIYEGEAIFNDVSNTHQYKNAIARAYQYALIEGVGNEKFQPDNQITREAALTIVARAMKFVGLEVEISDFEIEEVVKGFDDQGLISDWALKSVAICVQGDIIVGDKNNLTPEKQITRAETITIAARLIRKIDELL